MCLDGGVLWDRDEIDWFGGFRGTEEEMDTAWNLVGGKEQPAYRGVSGH